MIRKIFLCSLVFGMCFLNCFHTTKKINAISEKTEIKQDTIDSKEHFYRRVGELANEKIKNIENGIKDKSTNDSLSYYLHKYPPEEFFEDDRFKATIGRIIECEYLKVRNRGEFPPESFPVYNLSISGDIFLLGIINKKMGYTDFVCIDSIVLALDKIPQMQNDSIHKICIDLVKRNKTGGCKW